MAFYQFQAKQEISASRKEVWDFISSPANLKHITPDYMLFDVTSKNLPNKVYAGMMISYKVRPILGIEMDWLTEITHVREMEYFVDEQRQGPYALWHHQHQLEDISDGTLMTDIVTYAPPFGIIGSMANALMIRSKLNEIFKYRESAVTEYFNQAK